MYGGKTISTTAMNQHKGMAGAGMSGDFGCGKFPSGVQSMDKSCPDGVLSDAQRSGAVKGGMGMMQGAPDHGSMPKDSFTRDGKV